MECGSNFVSAIDREASIYWQSSSSGWGISIIIYSSGYNSPFTITNAACNGIIF